MRRTKRAIRGERGNGAAARGYRIAWLAAGCLILASCGRSRPAADARDLITIRTLGLAYLEENRLPEAETEFRKLIDLSPQEPLGYANLGLVYLRQGRYADAESQIARARRLDPADVGVRLSLAKVYELTDRVDDARRELEAALEQDSTDARVLWALADLDAEAEGPEALVRRRDYLTRLVQTSAANVAARLELIEVLLAHDDTDEVVRHLETIRQQLPQLPAQSTDFFDQALREARAGDAAAATTPARMFHNFMRVTPAYQSALVDVRGPGGALIGFPRVTFSENIALGSPDVDAVLAALAFTDVTEIVGLAPFAAGAAEGDPVGRPPALAVADYDGDGDADVFVTVGGVGRLLRNDGFTFVDVTAEVGLAAAGTPVAAVFGDYDNDGDADLFVARPDGASLYRRSAERFEDVSRTAGLAGLSGIVAALFLDADHEGDLDLVVVSSAGTRFLRNNGDGRFSDLSAQSGIEQGGPGRDLAFAEFNRDDVVDLVVAGRDAPRLLENQRSGRFAEVAAERGLGAIPGAAAVAVGDYDNDGFFDVFLGSATGTGHVLLHGRRDGTFERDDRPAVLYRALEGLAILDAEFFDFDNDGWLDLVAVGRPLAESRRGVALLRNDAPGSFADESSRLPATASAGARIAVADIGEDGDLDLVLAGSDGGMRLLRNDGGNANHYVKVQLVGLSTGSGKNNRDGIGARLEMRAGQLYQVRMATAPVTHFGLGQRLKADVLRIQWTNGVPQNLFYPGGDQDLVEEQVLKGSCAFLYTWDGQRFAFVTDVMWRSALGMPLGIMSAGDQAYAPPDASLEYVRIPGFMLVPRRGKYTIQLTEELWEVAYFDEVRLLAVDHPANVDVFVNERFVPAGPAPLDIVAVERRFLPIAARDQDGVDLLAVIGAKDDVYVSNLEPGRYQGVTRLHDLILDFGPVPADAPVRLFLQGWIFPTDASINVALSQSASREVVLPELALRGPDGVWRTVIPDLSFPAGKNKTVIADLSPHFTGGDLSVRLRTSMQLYWDHAFVGVGGTAPLRVTPLALDRADLHYRGYSRMYRKGGRYGPQWFDYETVTREPIWRPIEGRYTRFGDVTPLIRSADDHYVVMAPGDEMTVSFDAASAPPTPEGWTRDFLIYSAGWIKDADLNTATGNTVEPLPFHAMSRYPYGPDEAFPAGPEYRRFLEEYLTRAITRYDW